MSEQDHPERGGAFEAAIELQTEAAAQEQERFDHAEIEAGNREFITQVRVVRKRHRKNTEHELLEHDSDIDDEFKKGLVEAANKHGYKRRKKHMFTEDGIEIEPFHLRNDIRDGLLTSEGFIKTNLQDYDRKKE